MPITNIPSVLQHGILANELAAKLEHLSVAMAQIQDRREGVQIPGGLKLHQYANLYFHARNPMMSKLRSQAELLCVLRVSTEVLELPDVVLADQNASSKYVRFLSPAQISLINFTLVFATDWRHPGDQIAYWRHSSIKCAEVLIPHKVSPEFIEGAYVANETAAVALQAHGFIPEVQIDPHLFFR